MHYFYFKYLGLLPFLSCIAFFLGGCAETTSKSKPIIDHDNSFPDSYFRYNLEQPNIKFKLSKKLKEISGLTCYKDKWLGAVQDERGAIYLIDIESGKTVNKIEFSADGDYEGIACKEETFFVLRADGVLFEITDWDNKKKKDPKTKVIDTNLGEINDTEGLAYDAESNNLVIACKASAAIGVQVHKSRSIYAYDLDSAKFNIKPIYTITRKAFKKYIKANLKENPEFKPYKKEMKKAQKTIIIQPSAIAVHPISKHYYILCAEGRSLIVMDRNNKIKEVKRLSKKRFEQPEGITFASNGDLFISTEGNEKKAKIYKFDYIPKS